MTKKSSHIPQSPFSRATRLFASGAKMVAREVTGQLTGETNAATRIKQARDIVKTLGTLKGAAMKAGQLLSIQAADYLDPEIVAVLRELQDSVSFMPYNQVTMILKRQLGSEKFALIENLSIEPIAAASIGQVHTATIHGKKVAIKIQYPGVASSIDSDLNSLKSLIMGAAKLTGRNMDFAPVLDEINKSLKQEVNYLSEAKNLELTRTLIKDPAYVIPDVFHEFTTETVITQSFEDGERINHWIQSSPSNEDVYIFSKLVLDLVIHEMLHTGVVQTDPNYANFLYRPETKQLVLLDFGATISSSPELRQYLQSNILNLFHGEVDTVMKNIIARGHVSDQESEAVKNTIKELFSIVSTALMDNRHPLPIRNETLQKSLQIKVLNLGTSIKHTPPPKELILMGRKLGGMLNLLKEVDAKINVEQVKAQIKELKIA